MSDMNDADEVAVTAAIAALAQQVGITSVTMVAWRDLDDGEAGGSELHAHRIAACWARAGLNVEMRTSMVPGQPERIERDGYTVLRRGGRYQVFLQVMVEGIRRRWRNDEALVEIWNGMPFFGPLWFKGPRVVVLHHVHGPMWRLALSPLLARVGETIEQRLAPPLYRSSRILTLSNSSKHEIVEQLHLKASNIDVIAPGIEARFSTGGTLAEVPTVVSVGRLVPVKRIDVLIEQLIATKRHVPNLVAIIVGEGYLHDELTAQIARHNAESWLTLAGHVDDEELINLYRRAWVVTSASLREGWGMTLTEAAACGTPAVASEIAGHRDAVVHGVSGLLTEPGPHFVDALVRVLTDPSLRAELSLGALENAKRFRWGRTAEAAFRALAEVAEQRHRRSR
jgi:glycosyltransferase involved in cell wall biosynthesis